MDRILLMFSSNCMAVWLYLTTFLPRDAL